MIIRLFRRLVGIFTLGVSLAYLSTLLLPFIDTGKYWPISIIGLGFPILFFLLLILTVYWLVVGSRVWILCLIILLSGYKQIIVAFAFNIPKSFVLQKEEGTIRVMQWNVHSWNQLGMGKGEWIRKYSQSHMMDLIKEYDPDVICIQEFFEVKRKGKLPSNISDLKAMGFDYYYFPTKDLYDKYFAGTAIFSKHPIVDQGAVVLQEDSNMDPLAYLDVNINGNIFRFMAIHLQSVDFQGKQYRDISGIKKGQRPSVEDSRTILGKLKRGFQLRHDQSVKVGEQVDESPYPVVLCGDFNDVPNSGTYFNISRNLQDAFIKRGIWIGRTFRFISPTLRIDYILPGKEFKVVNFKRIKVPYSDHYPLVADLKYESGSE